MSKLLRSILVLAVAGLFTVACSKQEESVPVDASSAVVAPDAGSAVVAPMVEPLATGGGYEPTAEERVPGITLDPAAPATEATPAK
ncbi:MAG: hypothetical protein RLZZ379_670 [Pseudomonadota bacterium]